MELTKTISAYVALVIPVFFILSGILLLSGAYAAKGELPALNEVGLPILIISVLIVSSFNAFNAVFDYKIDRINKPNRPLPKGRVSKKGALYLSLFLYLLAIILSLSVASKTFMILAFFNIFLTIFYSAPNIRLKDSFLVTNIVIGLQYGAIPLMAGWTIYKDILTLPPQLYIPIFFLAMFIGSLKDFGDYMGDRTYKTKTLPVIFGPKRAAELVIALIMITLLSLMILSFSGIFSPLFTVFLVVALALICMPAINFLNDPIIKGDQFLLISAIFYLCIVIAMTLTINI